MPTAPPAQLGSGRGNIVLVLATSGPAGEVGLHREGQPLATLALGAGAARGRGLLPAVAALLTGAGLVPRDLTGVIVDVGPGSFTGVRVGVTAAKTLAFALRIPVLGVSSLEALAYTDAPAETVMPLRDAGRGTVYVAVYGPSQNGVRPLLGPPARIDAPALARLAPAARCVGEHAPRLAEALGRAGPTAIGVADAAAFLARGLARLVAGEAQSPATLVPLYLQASAPERLRAGEV